MSPEEQILQIKEDGAPLLHAQLQLSSATVKIAAPPPPFLLLLNGFPGVGKLTIARNLLRLLTPVSSGPSTGPQIRLLDNHLLIDPVSAIEPERTASHYRLRKSFRELAFAALETLPGDLVILMTSCLSETEEGRSQFAEFLAVARGRRCPMVVLNLVCGVEENGRRVECEERKGSANGFAKGKLTDRALLERFRREYKLLDLDKLEDAGVRLFCGEVETTELSVEETSAGVWRLLRKRLGFEVGVRGHDVAGVLPLV
jgi:hypothetical protein